MGLLCMHESFNQKLIVVEKQLLGSPRTPHKTTLRKSADLGHGTAELLHLVPQDGSLLTHVAELSCIHIKDAGLAIRHLWEQTLMQHSPGTNWREWISQVRAQ